MPNEELCISLMSGPQDGLQHRFPLPRGGKEVVLSIGRNEDPTFPWLTTARFRAPTPS